MMCTANHSRDGGDHIQVWVDAVLDDMSTPTSDDDYDRHHVDPISASRAVLWLVLASDDDHPNSPVTNAVDNYLVASLLAQGSAEIALLTSSQKHVDHGKGDGSRHWLPADVRAWPHRCSKSASSGNHSDGAMVEGGARRCSSTHHIGVLSLCLAEALGLKSEPPDCTQTAKKSTSLDGDGATNVKLVVRALQCVSPAAILHLRGPYPLRPSNDTTPIPGQVGTSYLASGGHHPPASLVAAVSSMLSCVLEGEIVATGSVVRVAGLFNVVVTEVWTTDQSRRSVAPHQLQQQRGTSEQQKSRQTWRRRLVPSNGAVRVHGATELHLAAPSTPSAAQVSRNRDGTNVGGEEHAVTASVCYKSSTNASDIKKSEPDGAVLLACPPTSAAGEGEHAKISNSRHPSVISDVHVCRDEEEWIRRVRRDFGDWESEASAAVSAAGAVLRSREIRSNAGCGCEGDGGGKGWLQSSWLLSSAGGLLLHGPTGAGKTLLARSVAEHSGVPWFFLDCSSVFRRDRGQAERHVQDALEQAGSCSPSIVVLDQVDMVSKRRPEAAGITELQVFSVLLETMDHFTRHRREKRVFFIATCQDTAALDPSLLQRGRIESVLRLGSLDTASRASILDIHARGMPLRLSSPPASSIVPSSATLLQENNTGKNNDASSATAQAPTATGGGAQASKADPASGHTDADKLGSGKRADKHDRKDSRTRSLRTKSVVHSSVAVEPPPRSRGEFLQLVAARCHGYLGCDLERLCREAAMRHMASRRVVTQFAACGDIDDGPGTDGANVTIGTAVYLRVAGLSNPSESFAADDERAMVAGDRSGAARRGQEEDCRDSMPMNSTNEEREMSSDIEDGGVRLQDFWAALDVVRPASLVGRSAWIWGGDGDGGRPEGGAASTPLVGCDSAMAELRAFLLAPLANASLLRRLGLRAATGALLYGPHGCGKTSVARALAAETRGVANFLEVRCSDLVDKVVGRSERSVSDLFAAARAAAPCILFLDQVEGVAARRGYHSSTEQTFDRILSTLLVEMDGVMSESGGHVVVLAATNDLNRLDPALLRPGRLDRRVYLGPPDSTARAAIFMQRLLKMPLQCAASVDEAPTTAGVGKTEEGQRGGEEVQGGGRTGVGDGEGEREGVCGVDLVERGRRNDRNVSGGELLGLATGWELDSVEAYAAWLAEETDGCSGAQVTGVCREAALAALRENIESQHLAPRHFEIALGSSRRREHEYSS